MVTAHGALGMRFGVRGIVLAAYEKTVPAMTRAFDTSGVFCFLGCVLRNYWRACDMLAFSLTRARMKKKLFVTTTTPG